MEAPRSFGGKGGAGGGYKESGLHVLYLLANSLVCLKGSGDRGSSGSQGASNASSFVTAHSDLNIDAPAAVTLLDERDPQQVNLAPSGPAQFVAAPAVGTSSIGAGCSAQFSAGELSMIRALALSECALPLFVHSLCPTIFGHELVKAGLLLGLFGGSSYKTRPHAGAGTDGDQVTAGATEGGAKEFQVRADIHVLVVGDPGLGKVRISSYDSLNWWIVPVLHHRINTCIFAESDVASGSHNRSPRRVRMRQHIHRSRANRLHI